jgi:hypothetical protein
MVANLKANKDKRCHSGIHRIQGCDHHARVVRRSLFRSALCCRPGCGHNPDAINIALGDVFIINRAGAVNATTLAAPAGGDEGRIIWIKNGTTQANTITVEGTAGLGGTAGSSKSFFFLLFLGTFSSFAGAFRTQSFIVESHL